VKAANDTTSAACPTANFLFMRELFSKNAPPHGQPARGSVSLPGLRFLFPLKMRADHSHPSPAGQGQLVAYSEFACIMMQNRRFCDFSGDAFDNYGIVI
jgi:hypothetical protein